MKVNPVQNYNKQTTSPSFGNIRCTSRVPSLFLTYGDADHFIKYTKELAKTPVELKYLIKTNDMSPKAIKLLEEFYEKIGGFEAEDFTVNFDYDSRLKPTLYLENGELAESKSDKTDFL